ncbi:MAG: hypothetical protein M1821_006859 [Bathelium mastoideum]|nr:MAG: hypothetical protein M1821_006859 [Bathelium mastoideum]
MSSQQDLRYDGYVRDAFDTDMPDGLIPAGVSTVSGDLLSYANELPDSQFFDEAFAYMADDLLTTDDNTGSVKDLDTSEGQALFRDAPVSEESISEPVAEGADDLSVLSETTPGADVVGRASSAAPPISWQKKDHFNDVHAKYQCGLGGCRVDQPFRFRKSDLYMHLVTSHGLFGNSVDRLIAQAAKAGDFIVNEAHLDNRLE